ncbi:glycosyltransferase family 2 protein [Flavisolibacter nicotianae]|uniref:glycosyltransferase family 2 protein n=1 Tax=Flavisolibacter nicotianae TaxID=2364882 RepID=UPI000EAF9BD7|nr:glycosyltransferase family 2 protein [Flavisolibacter nicotianae]
MLDLSIIIVTYNSEKYIGTCVNSITQNLHGLSYEIIVVDNLSTDSTQSILQQKQNVRLIRNEKNYGFATANNKGIALAQGNFVLILNPDIILTPATDLKAIIDYFEKNPSTGIVSPRLFYEDGKVQENARKFPSLLTFFIRGFRLEKYAQRFSFYKNHNVFSYISSTVPVEVDWVIGAFMFTRKKIIHQVGMFDQRFFMYYEDADLCSRIKRKGYTIVYDPGITAIHAYCRDSAKPLFSRLKMIHMKSFFRFFLKRNLNFS